MDALGHRAHRARHRRLIEMKVVLHRSRRHVARKHKQRRPALGGFRDSRQRVGKPRPGMHADKRQLLRRLGVGVCHAGGVALVPRRNDLHPRSGQRMRDLEVGRSKQRKAAARAVGGKILRQHFRNRPLACHAFSFTYPTSLFGSHVATAGNPINRASSSRLMTI
jgi:hypothetical protein